MNFLLQIILFHFVSLNLITRNFNITEPIFETFVLFCQQPLENHRSTRLRILTLSFSFLIIYNLYTSTFLSEILKSSSKIPSTMDEFIESPLQLYFEDLPYMDRYFHINSMNETIKKIISKNQIGKVPLFHKTESIVKIIRSGNSAFYCEKFAAYSFLEKSLQPEEICQLRQVGNLFVSGNSYFELVVQSESQYLEMFKYGLTRSMESGISHRELQLYQTHKPLCQSTGIVEFVSFKQVKCAFYLLGMVYCGSFIILGLEIICYFKTNEILLSS